MESDDDWKSDAELAAFDSYMKRRRFKSIVFGALVGLAAIVVMGLAVAAISSLTHSISP